MIFTRYSLFKHFCILECMKLCKKCLNYSGCAYIFAVISEKITTPGKKFRDRRLQRQRQIPCLPAKRKTLGLKLKFDNIHFKGIAKSIHAFSLLSPLNFKIVDILFQIGVCPSIPALACQRVVGILVALHHPKQSKTK